MLITSIAIGFLLSSADKQAGVCNDFAFKELLKGAPRYEYRGRYVNREYQYSVRVPKGLTAYDGRSEANHQGFGLALGEPPQSYIFVGGEHNSLEYDVSREAAKQKAEWLRKERKTVESETISESHLGPLGAVLLEAIYTCPGSTDRYMLSSVMALSSDKRFIYALELYSPANRYESDRAVLNRILKSWTVMPRSRPRPRS
jgi:hypothetical protein